VSRLLSIFSGLIGVVSTIFSWLRERQMVEKGRQEAAIEAIKKVEENAQKADRAVAVDDANRTERLRKRFNRAAGGE
jgi:hypothetical protein